MAPAQAIALSGSSQQIRSGPAMYAGLAVRESGGSNPVSVRVYDGTSAAGVLLDAVDLAAGATAARLYDRPTWCQVGIWVELAGTGTVQGSVRVA